MNMPFFKFGLFEVNTSLLIAVFLGIGFGFFLERGGFGNARKLAGQFYLRDFTVFKGMFTAIITAMLGVFWLSQTGLMDVSRLYMNPTYIIPQLTAGLVFGIGFVMSGLCPGTACVSIATGKTDGLLTLLGILFGIFIFGELFESISPFFYSTAMGPATISQVTGIWQGLIVLGVVVLALTVFIIIGKFERTAGIDRTIKTPVPIKILGGAALCLGIMAGFTKPSHYTVENYQDQVVTEMLIDFELERVGVHKLAEWIMQKRENMILIDSRTISQFHRYHIPSNKTIHFSVMEEEPVTGLAVIVYGEKEIERNDLNRVIALDPSVIYVLDGGMDNWKKSVLFPDLSYSNLSDKENQRLKRISNYFGGHPFVREQSQSKSTQKFSREGC